MTGSVLVTGGLGYVGGRVVDHLLNDPELDLIIGTHRKSITRPAWLKRGKIVEIDLDSPENLFRNCQGVGKIIHLAALNEIECAENPGRALEINTSGTLRLLQVAEKAGVERFIYFSTAHIYGAPLLGKITEENLPRPIHPYAITHRGAEDLVLAAHDQREITGIVLRLSNGFGTPMDPGINRWTLITNDLCRQAVTTGQLTLRSSGLQARDFITLTDVSRAAAHFLSLPAAQCDNGIFNLGGHCSMTVYELTLRIASRCQVVLGFTPAILRPEPKSGETSGRLDFAIEKLKATGFDLAGNMDDEIDATLRLCQKAFGGSR